jgi:hypothetical protein
MKRANRTLDIARQKLPALGVTAKEIAALPDEPEADLRRQEVVAPMSGRIVDRRVYLGDGVGRDKSFDGAPCSDAPTDGNNAAHSRDRPTPRLYRL